MKTIEILVMTKENEPLFRINFCTDRTDLKEIVKEELENKEIEEGSKIIVSVYRR